MTYKPPEPFPVAPQVDVHVKMPLRTMFRKKILLILKKKLDFWKQW